MERFLSRLSLLLILGIAINLAIAWVIAYRHVDRSAGPWHWLGRPENEEWWVARRPTEWADSVVVSVRCWQGFGRRLTIAHAHLKPPELVPDYGFSGAVGYGPEGPPAPVGFVERDRDAHILEAEYGWPLRSLRWTSLSGDLAGAPFLRSPVVDISDPVARGSRLLPLVPNWPAFIANSMLFSAVCASALFGPRTVRSVARALRGCCPHCGYLVGGSSRCSECGASVRRRWFHRARAHVA
jgi:hypothetical protein